MSMTQEILSFLIPDINESIQSIFFALMIGGMAVTIAKVKVSATPANWERKWNGETNSNLSSALDAEHGSVSDISDAVATSWEKLSEAMPGILLILGLLGTFLGLGVALNKASTILGGASAIGLDDSIMSNLTDMMKGLGTKFKTSTWGIMAFLILKVWVSYNGFEEKRLRWCIRKIKGELDSKRADSKQQQQNEQQQFIGSINQLGERLCLSLQTEASNNRLVLQQNQELLAKKIQLSTQNKAGIAIIINSLKQQHDQNEAMLTHSLATRTSLETFVESNASNLKSMQESSLQMADAASRVGESAGSLKLAIGDFSAGVTDVLTTLKNDLNETMKQMSSQTTEAATDLKTSIGNFQSGVSDVMSTMKSDLRESISQMSDDFGQNMSQMSNNLEAATSGISNAVGALSISVDETMLSVKKSLEDSSAVQKAGIVEFINKSEELSTETQAMTGLIEKVTKDISQSLKAVSESNRNAVESNKNLLTIMKRSDDMNNGAEKTAIAINQFVESIKKTDDNSSTKKSFNDMLTLLTNIDQNLCSVLQKEEVISDLVETSQ